MENFQEIADDFLAEGALVQVARRGRSWAARSARLLADPAERERSGRARAALVEPQPRRAARGRWTRWRSCWRDRASVARPVGAVFGGRRRPPRARSTRADCCGAHAAVARPVISVGNLAVGGRGKTPLVARIAALLREAGRPVAS